MNIERELANFIMTSKMDDNHRHFRKNRIGSKYAVNKVYNLLDKLYLAFDMSITQQEGRERSRYGYSCLRPT